MRRLTSSPPFPPAPPAHGAAPHSDGFPCAGAPSRDWCQIVSKSQDWTQSCHPDPSLGSSPWCPLPPSCAQCRELGSPSSCDQGIQVKWEHHCHSIQQDHSGALPTSCILSGETGTACGSALIKWEAGPQGLSSGAGHVLPLRTYQVRLSASCTHGTRSG